MRTSLEHLPKKKQKEILRIAEVIIEAVQPEKIILFGSYATGKWVESQHMEGHALHEYTSDYDILVIAQSGDERPEFQVESIVEDSCDFKAPISIIVHTIDFVNKRLLEGHYFFSDVKREGVLLYDAGNIPIAEQRELTWAERSRMAKDDFDYWISGAEDFLKAVMVTATNENLNIPAFMLHQAAERTYSAAMLVFTGYKPRTHNLGKLIRLCRDFSPELAGVMANKTREEKHYFKLLKSAYIDSRYKKKYSITRGELFFLIEKVKELQTIAGRICQEKLAEFERLAES